MTIANKHIVLGITGGIAAYKAVELVRQLKRAGAEVRVVLTHSAKKFITPLTMQTVSQHPVYEDLFDPNNSQTLTHIELARWADLLLVAPATANCIAQFNAGLAPDLLGTLYLATNAKCIIVPAMNQQMWQHPATKKNIVDLKERGVHILGPDEGDQACGETGTGRMVEPTAIVDYLSLFFTRKDLNNINVLITAGPTREPIDPVRYISNRSSGKMGYALADAATNLGASVTLISGPVSLQKPFIAKCVDVETADEMHDAVMQTIPTTDIFISVAAVADFRSKKPALEKIKKSKGDLVLEFSQNQDILSNVSKLDNPPYLVGFVAETEQLNDYAKQKFKNKNLDLVIANNVGRKDIGFDSDKNACVAIWKDNQHEFPTLSKKLLANKLISLITKQYNEKNTTKNIR